MELANLLNVTTLLSMFDTIHKLESEFYVHPAGRNVTLILGGTGVGKSTIVQRLIGLDSEMIAVQDELTDKYYIDQPNKTEIGHDITVSKTIIPEILKNNRTGAFIGDMPGFDDTRGLPFKLTTTYFMKKIINEIDYVKLVFLTSWSTIDGTGNRDGFYNFLRTVSKYVKNIAKFNNSVALVVTKIPPGMQTTIVQKIVKILKRISTSMDRDVDKTFLNIILQDVNGTYPKINVAKIPDINGSKLSDISYMVDNTANLTSMIDKLEFTKVSFSDFGYTLPENALHDITNLGKIIENDIHSYMELYMLNFTNFLTNKISRFNDIFKLKNEYISLHDKLIEIKGKLNSETEVSKCISKLRKGLDLIHHWPSILLTNATLHSNYLSILQSLNQFEPFDCSKTLKFAIKKASESRKWFLFLEQLYSTLTSYEIQKDIRSSKCFALSKIGHDLKINSKDILKKLEHCHSTYDYKDVYNMDLDSSKIVALQKLLNFTVNSNLQISCDSNLLRVRGRYVRFTDVRDAIQYNCSLLPKKIQIFALDRIYANGDLNLTSHLSTTDEAVQFSIIAPNWYIDGNSQITLDGKSGAAIAPQKNTISGAVGKPGLPGGPGGHFLGLGTKFINFNHLVISLKGGDGGEGQAGGDGVDGTKGDNADGTDIEEYTIDKEQNDSRQFWINKGNGWDKSLEKYYVFSGIRIQLKKEEDPSRIGSKPISLSDKYKFFISKHHLEVNDTCGKNSTHVRVVAQGYEGTKGTNGGSGGIGGIGGNAGNYFPAVLNETFVINLKEGSTGLAAKGGEGGKGGKNGNSFILTKPCSESKFGPNIIKQEIVESTDAPAPNGENGMTGGNGENRKNPKPGTPIHQLNLFEIINDYKQYLRENLPNCEIESKLIEFFSYLENDKEIAKIYDTVGLIDDFEKLESQYFALHGSMSFLPFYESLFNRIVDDTSDETLNYLRTTLFTKIYNIKYNADDYVVVNIKNYADIVQNDAANYENIIQKINIISHHENYENTIREQIIEANKFITEQVFPEIENVYAEINGQILALVENIYNQKNELVKQESEMYEKSSKLLSLIPTKTSIILLKSVASLLALAGPYGMVASIPIAVGANLAEGNVDEEYSKIVSSVEKASAQFIDTSKYDKTLNTINKNNSLELNSTGELNGKDKSEVEMKGIVGEIDRFSQDLSLYTNILDVTIKQQKENKQDEEKSKSHDVHVQLNKTNVKANSLKCGVVAEKLNEVGKEILGELNKFKTDSSRIAKKISETYEQISQLKTIERYYKEILVSDVNNFDTQMFHNLTNLADKSLINLDLIKWKMENALKDFKVKMEYMIQPPSDNTNLKAKILNCVDKLQGGMTTMVKIYERIQNYKDQQKLAGLINNIQNITSKDIKMNALKSTLKANLILLEYEKIFNTFKLFLFPSIHRYQNLSSNFVWSKKLTEDVISRAKENIESIKRTLNLHLNALHTQTKFSNSEYVGNDSFIIWDYNLYKTEISKLLKGEEVTLEADITQSHMADAMKFKEIGIAFLFANKTLENEFNNEIGKISVVMTHLGNSGYKCGEKYYILNHNVINITHSLKAKVIENSFKGYDSYDDNYDKLKNNIPVFSPYATWRLKLYVSSTSRRASRNSFFQSGKFLNQTVDVALEGIGGYVASASCKNLDKYYTVM